MLTWTPLALSAIRARHTTRTPAPSTCDFSSSPTPPLATMSLASCVASSAALAPRRSAPRALRESSRIASSRRRARLVVRAGAPVKTVEEAKEMLDREGYKMLDIRPFKAYDREHSRSPRSAR